MDTGISQLLAPWMMGNQFSPTDYGGTQNLGAALLAMSGPSEMPMSFGQRLGIALQGAQQSGMQNAKNRLDVAGNSIALQQNMQTWPLIQAAMSRYAQGIMAPSAGGAQTTQAPSASAAPSGPQAAQDAISRDAQPPQGASAQGPVQAPWMGAGPSPTGGPSPMESVNLGALMALAGRPQGKTLIDVGKTQLQYDPQTATSMALAKDPLTLDMSMLRTAVASGDQMAAKAAYTKYLQDAGQLHVGSMNGNVTTFGGLSPQALGMSNVNPARGTQMVNGVESNIPGSLGATYAAKSAEARGTAEGETVPMTDVTGKVTGVAGSTYYVPKSTVVAGGAASRQMPVGGASPTGAGPSAQAPVAAPGPAMGTFMKGNADNAVETNKELQSKAEGAQQMLAQVQELRAAANEFTPGQFADGRAKMLNYLNSTGLISDQQKKELGSYQAGQKIAIQLQAAATKQLGSREAAQVFSFMGKSLPNLTLSPNGLEKVSAWQEGIAQYDIARAAYANQLAQQNDIKGVNQTRDTWIKNSNPLYYVVASASPDVQKEFLRSMGPAKAKQFTDQWHNAISQGFAPPLSQE